MNLISVIIPTRNRPLFLAKCLKRLLPQLNPKDEVLVVNNGENEPMKQVVATLAKHAKVRYFKELRRGPSYARNLGIKHAKGDILAFLDDDCIVSTSWLRTIRQTCHNLESETTVYQGAIQHIPTTRSLLVTYASQVRKYQWEYIKQQQQWRMGHYIDFLNAGNFFLRRAILTQNKITFDQRNFPFIGEERDLAYQLQLLGYPIRFISQAKVKHFQKPATYFRGFITAWQYGVALGKLEAKYLNKNYNSFRNEPLVSSFQNIDGKHAWRLRIYIALKRVVTVISTHFGKILYNLSSMID